MEIPAGFKNTEFKIVRQNKSLFHNGMRISTKIYVISPFNNIQSDKKERSFILHNLITTNKCLTQFHINNK